MKIDIDSVQIRPILESEWEDAMGLAWKVFLQFEAPIYTHEGINNFRNFITDQTLKRMFLVGEYRVYGAFYRGVMVGVASLRNREHISLLFVDPEFHKNGIGRKLLHAFRDFEKTISGYKLTVNAAPYAVKFYHSIGFVDTNIEQFKDGIQYTPMSWIF